MPVEAQSFLDHLEKMKTKWGSTIVARSSIPEFTGGAVSAGHVANCDAKGEGPEGSFMLGKQKVYPVVPLVEWLKGRATDKKMPRVKKL